MNVNNVRIWSKQLTEGRKTVISYSQIMSLEKAQSKLKIIRRADEKELLTGMKRIVTPASTSQKEAIDLLG